MGCLFNDHQIVLAGNKTYPGFHTPSWMSIIVGMTSLGARDRKRFLNRSASSVQ